MESTSIAALYEAEHSRLKQMLMRRGLSAQSAADVVQDAFLKLLRSNPTADVRDLSSYLRRTATTVAVDHFRNEQRAARLVNPAAAVDDSYADPVPLAEAAMISEEELAALAAAVAELPPRTREVLLLHKYEGLTYREISERLGIAKNTVMVHMVKALGCLKAKLREGGTAGD